jgi:hypothetical protein
MGAITYFLRAEFDSLTFPLQAQYDHVAVANRMSGRNVIVGSSVAQHQLLLG